VKIKGSALLARREIVTRRFGADAWARLVADMAAVYPYFHSHLMASSLVPVPEFLAFHDELLRRFYPDDDGIYFRLGEESAAWALTEGPYKNFMARKDVASFVGSAANLSNAYWAEAACVYTAVLEGDVVDFQVAGIPYWHPYFEYLVAGYVKGALEMLCGNRVTAECVKGGSGTEYHYRFHLSGEPLAPPRDAR
jgi:hypothetical protein